MAKKRIGIVIGKIGGLDGVALETEKWIEVLKRMNYEIFVLSGLYERCLCSIPKRNQTEEPLLSFYSSGNRIIRDKAFMHPEMDCSNLLERIEKQSTKIAKIIDSWLDKNKIDILISENASSLPAHFPLGIAIKKISEVKDIKIICHDHDFYWERGKQYVSQFKEINKIVRDSYPLRSKNAKHVTINHFNKDNLKKKFGIDAEVIPNVMDFKKEFGKPTNKNKNLPKDLGINEGDILLFQVTRIIARKNIETAIELVKRLDDPRVKLIITGELEDDVDKKYLKFLRKLVSKEGLEKQIIFAGEHFDSCSSYFEKGVAGKCKYANVYEIPDAYANAIACTYFSSYEGFGNALIEAIVAKKPIFVNRYKPVYPQEIGNKGFKIVEIENNKLTKNSIEEIKKIIYNPKLAKKIAEHNFKKGKKYFSYEVLEKKLRKVLK